MGAINYKTSEYITLGVRPYELSDFEEDREFMNELRAEVAEYGGTVEEALRDYIEECYNSDYENVKTELEKYMFYWFDVQIEPGYYEGFTIDLRANWYRFFDAYWEKLDALEELKTLKQLLIDCAGFGMVQCFTGWCAGYRDYEDTVKAIKKACAQMRRDIISTPTWKTYKKASEAA